MKRVITFQDLSCVGKCSLGVALPIISSFGIEACGVPSALLSCHTAFDDFSFFDLTAQSQEILNKIGSQKLKFDAFYSGYLGSEKQINCACEFIDVLKDSLIIVDPVMGDNGKLYSGFDISIPQSMKNLCSKADIILPNITEACLLADTPYFTPANKDEVVSLIKKLFSRFNASIVITGIEAEGRMGACLYNKDSGRISFFMKKKIDAVFHGTGDIFASCLTGDLISGSSLNDSVEFAVEFTYKSMEYTLADPDRRWYGVNFEQALPLISNSRHN